MHTETRNKKVSPFIVRYRLIWQRSRLLLTAVAVRFPFCRTLPEFLIYEQSPGFGLLAVNRNEPIICELLGDYFTRACGSELVLIRKPPNDSAGAFEILVQQTRCVAHLSEPSLICSAVLKRRRQEGSAPNAARWRDTILFAFLKGQQPCICMG